MVIRTGIVEAGAGVGREAVDQGVVEGPKGVATGRSAKYSARREVAQ
jgi:hypothetical protein